MRILLTILFFWACTAHATIYYVSNAGSDASNGTSTGTSWQTIAKVNGSTFSPGDQILFKRGDSWNERFLPPSSGSTGNPVIFGAYGTGTKPVITGLQNLTGWVNTTGNIWEATATNSVSYQRTIVINGAITAKGRYPNSTYLVSSNGGNTVSRIITSLSGTPNYAGAEAVIKSYEFIIDVCKIVSQSADTLKFYPTFSDFQPNTAITYPDPICDFFIQNSALVLDVQNEWCYDSATKKVSIYSVGSPANVQYSTLDTLVFLTNKDYITFDGLSFTGSNSMGIRYDTAQHIVIQNCTLNNNGGDAISARVSSYSIIQNDTITNTFNDGVFAIRDCNYILINNNYIKNTGTKEGMGGNANGTYIALFPQGLSPVITNNTIDSTGYNGVYFLGTNTLVKNNYITNFCLQKSDGGGVYTYGDTYNSAGSIIRSNILINGGGNYPFGWVAAGVYLDFQSHYILVDSNTISNCRVGGIFFNAPDNCNIRDNTVIDSIGACWYYGASGGSAFEFKRNIFYQKDSFNYCINTVYVNDNGGNIGYNIDSNYYLKPIKQSTIIKNNNDIYNLASWIATQNLDHHAKGTPAGITSIYPLFLYNPTLSDSTVSLSGSYVSATGTTHSGSIVIKPYQSKILFPAQVIIPPGTSSRIGNLNFQ